VADKSGANRTDAHCGGDANPGPIGRGTAGDGQRIISGGNDNAVRVWDMASGTELAHWFADRTVTSCTGHPSDPNTFIYGADDGQVVVLSLRRSG
jgi:WD40 repeat protein